MSCTSKKEYKAKIKELKKLENEIKMDIEKRLKNNGKLSRSDQIHILNHYFGNPDKEKIYSIKRNKERSE